MEKVNYIFCLTGRPSSYSVALGLTDILIMMKNAGKTVGIKNVICNNIYEARNSCLKKDTNNSVHQKPFEQEYSDYDKIIWMDSDNIINTDHIKKLLEWDLDIVCGWYKIMGTDVMSCGVNSIPYTLDQMQKTDLPIIEVDWSGMGLMIVKKGVFESLSYPWFKCYTKRWKEGNKYMERNVFDDEGFCDRVKDNGYKIYVDPSVYIEHEKIGLL